MESTAHLTLAVAAVVDHLTVMLLVRAAVEALES
jgi:hypothetical protein